MYQLEIWQFGKLYTIPAGETMEQAKRVARHWIKRAKELNDTTCRGYIKKDNIWIKKFDIMVNGGKIESND